MNISQILEESRRLLVEQYVFPAVGSQIAALLADREAAGRYRDVADAAELGKLVTDDLQSINQDKHLRLKYHEMGIPDLPSEAMMTAVSRRDAARSMNGVGRVELLDGNVAVLQLGRLFPPSISGEAIAAAMTLAATADALVLDLRECLGGDPDTVALVCSYLFDERVHLNDMYERDGDRTTQSWTQPYVPGRRFGAGKPICVLTSSRTFSAGEELSYDLQQLGRATLVGELTGGGAHPRIGVRLHPHLELTVPTGRAINPVSGTNWEGTGVEPDVAVSAEQALDAALEVFENVTASEFRE